MSLRPSLSPLDGTPNKRFLSNTAVATVTRQVAGWYGNHASSIWVFGENDWGSTQSLWNLQRWTGKILSKYYTYACRNDSVNCADAQ